MKRIFLALACALVASVAVAQPIPGSNITPPVFVTNPSINGGNITPATVGVNASTCAAPGLYLTTAPTTGIAFTTTPDVQVCAGAQTVGTFSGTALTLPRTLALPTTTGATTGVIDQNGNRLLHTFNPPLGTATERNLFLGRLAGNFTLTTAGGADPATDGQFNLGIGDSALNALTRGSWNIGIGNAALRSLTTGAGNIVIGGDAMLDLTTGIDNTAMGSDALRNMAGAAELNTAIGARAMKTNTTGSNNTVMGWQAYGSAAGTGSNNVVIGKSALLVGTTAAQNVIVGTDAMILATTGQNNVVVGNGAAPVATTAGANAIIGAGAGLLLTEGTNNTFIGLQAGKNVTTGDGNIVIGDQLTAASATGDWQINIGGVLIGTASAGSTPGLTGTFLAGAAATPSVKIGSGAGFYNPSVDRVNLSTGGVNRHAWEAGFYSIVDNGATVRFGSGNDVYVHRTGGAGTGGLAFDSDGAGGALASVAVYGPLVANGGINLATVAVSRTAPTLPVACTTPTVTWSNGTATFQIDVGGTCAAVTTLAVTLPAVSNAWSCTAVNVTTSATARVEMTASTTTTVTFTNYTRTTGLALAWVDGADVRISCLGG